MPEENEATIRELLRTTAERLSALRKEKMEGDREFAYDFDPINHVWGLSEMNSS